MVVKELHGLPYGSHRQYVQRRKDGWHARDNNFIPAQEVDIYASASAWLSPSAAFNSSNSWKHSRHVLLRQDLVLDYDSRDLSHVERTLEVLGALGHFKFLFVNTHDGYHLWDFSFGDTLAMPENVYARMQHAEKEQRVALALLKDAGVELDYAASQGCKRIFRVPWSLHSKGTQCTARVITLAKNAITSQPTMGARGVNAPMSVPHRAVGEKRG